jgi:hypothetical protein
MDADVLGDYILVSVRNPSDIAGFYLISWKIGTVRLVNVLGKSHLSLESVRSLRLCKSPLI